MVHPWRTKEDLKAWFIEPFTTFRISGNAVNALSPYPIYSCPLMYFRVSVLQTDLACSLQVYGLECMTCSGPAGYEWLEEGPESLFQGEHLCSPGKRHGKFNDSYINDWSMTNVWLLELICLVTWTPWTSSMDSVTFWSASTMWSVSLWMMTSNGPCFSIGWLRSS